MPSQPFRHTSSHLNPPLLAHTSIPPTVPVLCETSGFAQALGLGGPLSTPLLYFFAEASLGGRCPCTTKAVPTVTSSLTPL